jgi:methyl-accepting chemotaxis protein
MSQEELPNAGHFGRQIRLLESVVSMPALSVVLAYLGLLLGLTSMQWLNIGVAVAVFIVVVAVAMEFPRRSRLAPVLAYLQVRSEGEKPAPDACRKAFHSVIALPKKQMQGSMMIWISAPPFVVCLTWALGLIHWRFDHQLFVILSAGVLGALISGSFVFFGLKRTLGPVRGALGFDISDPAERAALVTTTSLPRKVQLVVLGAVLGTSLLIGSLSQSRATQSVERLTVDWQQRVLANLEKRVESGQIFEQAVLESVPDTDLMPHPASFFLIDLEELADMGEPDDLVGRELVARISAAVSAGELHGEIIGGTANGGVAWRRLGARRLFISTLDEGSANASFDAFYVAMALALMLSAGFSLGVAHLLADDFKRATRSLSQDAERMAQGDLSRGQVWEAEDEMGSLARAFERMGGALRATVGRVAEAADRVDAAAGEISTVSQGVAIASADQVRRIQQANELMVQIKEQVGGVSDSAQNLNVSVEESSSSILELGAAGDELNDTASVLSSKVEEVSGSIEQMVRSVKQVGATTDGLSDAAADTSSSMEEMASAMRAVDNTAELTAKLSNEVVTLAEGGQEKVSQTISGMEAIRDATDAAERVIRGLGARAKEIGGILDVIDDVADETNLLALNAAIIAAQAGEHGRAFSVVADEIKELADRVLASTKEISQLIRSVQEESDNAIGAIEAGSSSVATGVERSAEAGTSLEEITRASRESGTRIGEIVSAVREQTKATAHVVSLMEAVRDGVAQISVAGGEQDKGNEVVYRSAVTMKEVAQQVRRTTEEQSRGFGRIRESVEGVRESVESINGSLQEQTTACSQVASFLEQVFEGTRSNEEAAQRMGRSMQELVAQAQALRDDVAKFQI